METLERVATEVTVRKIAEHFEPFIDDKDDSDEMLGGKTPNIKKHEKEVLEKKRADLRLEWKKVWERGPTPTIIEERKKSTAKKRKESRMKKKEGKEKDEKKNGVFLQRWIHGSNPEETSKLTQPDQPGKIGEIKKKLGMTDESEKKGKEDDTENKKRKFTAIRSKFEKEDTPSKIPKMRPKVDESWIGLSCDNQEAPEVQRVRVMKTRLAVGKVKEETDVDRRRQKYNQDVPRVGEIKKTAAVGPKLKNNHGIYTCENNGVGCNNSDVHSMQPKLRRDNVLMREGLEDKTGTPKGIFNENLDRLYGMRGQIVTDI